MKGLTVLAAVLLAGLFPATGLACGKTGKLAALISYVGTRYGDLPATLDTDPAVQARLKRLPAPVRAHLKRNLDVRGPVDLIDCHLVVSGNADHMGGEENAVLDVNLYSGAVTAAILSHHRVIIYLDRDPSAGSGYNAVPIAVRWWAAMAATGFDAANRPPAGTEVIRSEAR